MIEKTPDDRDDDDDDDEVTEKGEDDATVKGRFVVILTEDFSIRREREKEKERETRCT